MEGSAEMLCEPDEENEEGEEHYDAHENELGYSEAVVSEGGGIISSGLS